MEAKPRVAEHKTPGVQAFFFRLGTLFWGAQPVAITDGTPLAVGGVPCPGLFVATRSSIGGGFLDFWRQDSVRVDGFAATSMSQTMLLLFTSDEAVLSCPVLYGLATIYYHEFRFQML